MIREDARQFARTVLGRERLFDGLQRVLPELTAHGIPVMPLKGVLLACCMPEALDRPLSDADLLVPTSRLASAIAVLVRLGGRAFPGRHGVRKCVVVFGGRDDGWNIDVHAELWAPGFIPLDVEAAWAGSSEVTFLGSTLRLPPRRFAFAHVVGHFARSGHGPTRPARRASEIAAILDWTLETDTPATLVAYLTAHGAVPAAVYALAAAAAETTSASVGTVLALLPIGRWRARLLRGLALGPALPPRLLRPLLSA